jgi:hypothetical protein
MNIYTVQIMTKTTLSVIKADVGSLAGHHVVHPEQIRVSEGSMKAAKESGLIKDFCVTNCGDDLELIMTHRRGKTTRRSMGSHGILSTRRPPSPESWACMQRGRIFSATRTLETSRGWGQDMQRWSSRSARESR